MADEGTVYPPEIAVYTVQISTAEGTQTRTVRAAYDVIEDGWLVFRDHENRMVARFSEHLVIMAERGDRVRAEVRSDEDRIRDAMVQARDHPGRIITR